MISTPMHLLATRLGIRDGEAYTVVSGLVVALLLAAVGLPGVLREHEVLPFDRAVGSLAPAPSAPPAVTGADVPAPADVRSAPSTPARPGAPTAAGRADDTRPAAVAAGQRSSTSDGRVAGDVVRFGRAPEPGGADGMAVGPDGTVYVTSDTAEGSASVLWAFSRAGRLVDSWEAPDQPTVRSRGLTGVAVAPGGTVLVTDAATARVLRLDRAAGALVPIATVGDLPACGLLPLAEPCETGVVDSAPLLTGIAVAPDGTAVVADRAQGVVWRLSGDELEVLAALEDRLPGDGPVAVSFLTRSELLVAVGARSASFPPGLPTVVRIRITADGAEAPQVVADLELGEVPGDLVVGSSGRAYVTIPSAGLVVDLGVDQGDRIDLDVGSGEPPIGEPTGITLRHRSLLLSEPSGSLFDLAVNDRPAT